MVRMAKDQIRQVSRDDLERAFRRNHAFGMTISEMRRHLGELDNNIESCDMKEALWSQESLIHLALATEEIARQELKRGIEGGRGSVLPPELCHRILDEVGDTYKYLMDSGKGAANCECRRKK